MNRLIAFALVLLALPSFANDFRVAPEPDFEGLIVKATQPMRARDAFAGLAECEIVDSQLLRQPTSKEAEAMLAPCVGALARRYNSPLSVESLPNAPENGVGAQVEGLAFYVPEQVAVTDPLMRDLQEGLSSRRGRVLGHQAFVRRGSAPTANKPLLAPEALTQSSVQSAIDACITIQPVRRIRTSEEFIRLYGRCIVSDRRLGIKEIVPAPGRPMSVMLLSEAGLEVVRTLNGVVSVDHHEGPVRVSVIAHDAAVRFQPI